MRAALALALAAAALAAPADAAPRHPWLAAADARCAASTREAKVLAATAPTIGTQEEAMEFLRSGVGIGMRLLGRLRAAGPTPADADAQRFMRLFGRSVDLDRKNLAALERSVDPQQIERWIVEGRALELSARRAALRAGLRECARYLDPKTYA